MFQHSRPFDRYCKDSFLKNMKSITGIVCKELEDDRLWEEYEQK